MAKGQAKIPAWKAEWDRLVGNHKYLEIKHWAKYQPEMEEGNTYPWFKSYASTDEDALGDDEGFYIRGVKDALRRWRARRGTPLPALMETMFTGTACHKCDRPNLPRTIVALVSHGFLIPCNDGFTPKKRREEKKGNKNTPPPEKTEPKPETPAPAASALKRVQGIVPMKFRALLDWDEDVGDIPADQIRRAIRWRWKQPDDQWIRTKCSPGWIRANAQKLIDGVPPQNLEPTYESKPDPDCKKCGGEGEIIEQSGLVQTSATCSCVHQVEVG